MYIEACESGSMFEGILPDNIDVYAITAANAAESSYATYCYPDDLINGVHINSCLGDLFSVNWMEDADASVSSTETLDVQFKKVKNLTDKSHVMRYGDLAFKTEVVGDFYGDLETTISTPIVSKSTLFFNKLFKQARSLSST
jgi:legumain